MKKLKLIISTLIFISSFSTYSQAGNPETAVGFECGGAGSSTKPVQKVYGHLDKKEYINIVKLLYSKNTAEKFLAIIVCEKLAEKKKVKLNAKDLEIIKYSYSSDEFVYVCEGCDYDDKFKLSILLNAKENVDSIRNEAEEYFINVL